MATQLRVNLSHPGFPDLAGKNSVDILVETPGASEADAEKFADIVLDAVTEARKSAAGAHLVDYESFGNDSAYLDRIDAVAAEMTVDHVALVGKAARYSVTGTYSDGGGTWGDWVEATSDGEAEFQAQWAMAENQGASPKDFETFLETVTDIEITECSREPVTKEEYVEALKALVEEAVAAGHGGDALDQAIARLASDGHEIASPGPRP